MTTRRQTTITLRRTLGAIAAAAILTGIVGSWPAGAPISSAVSAGSLATPDGTSASRCATAPVYDVRGPQGTVYRLYQVILGRAPDRTGFDHWVQMAAGGRSWTSIAAEMMRSPEFAALVPADAGDQVFLRVVWEHAYGWPIEDWRLADLLRQMEEGTTRTGVVLYFADSPEVRARTDTGVPPGYRPLILRLEGHGDSERTVCLAEPALYRTAATNTWEHQEARTEMWALDGAHAVVDELQVGPPRFEWEGVAGEEGMVRSWASVETIVVDTAAGQDTSIDSTEWSIEILPVSFARPADPVHARGQFDAVHHVFVPFDRPVDLWTGGASMRVTAYDGIGRWKGIVFESSNSTVDGVLGRGVVPAGTGYLYVDVDDGQRWMVAATPTGSSTVRVEDPRGDVVITAGFGDNPAYEPRTDLLSYRSSFDERVEFRLEFVQIEPDRSRDVWVGFDIDVVSPLGYPDFVVFPTESGSGLHELRDEMYRYVCDVERSIEGSTHVVSFDSSCVGAATQLQLAGPYRWSVDTGTRPEMYDPCWFRPDLQADCPVWATYSDEIPASPPIVRAP